MALRHRRSSVVIAVSTAIVLSVAVGALLAIPRPSVEIRVIDVRMVPDVPQAGMTDIRFQFVLRNVGLTQTDFALLTLYATDPAKDTLFDTFTHREIRLEPGESRTFAESTFVSGQWSEVAFTVKVFPSGGPSWERSLGPDQPQTWTP